MEIVTKIAPLCLAIIMFILGLGLTINDFLRVIKYPKNFLVGFICQVILLPIIAFILINLITLTPEIALGVMIIAAAPGGVTSNVLTKFANGDIALSVSLTAIVSLISIATVPFIVFHSANFLEIEILKEIAMSSIATKMFFVVTVPVLLGMIIRKLKQDLVMAYESLFQKISIILFLIVFTAIWVEEWGEIMSYIKTAGLISIILNMTPAWASAYAPAGLSVSPCFCAHLRPRVRERKRVFPVARSFGRSVGSAGRPPVIRAHPRFGCASPARACH